MSLCLWNLMPSPSRLGQHWIESRATSWCPKHCFVVWRKSPHPHYGNDSRIFLHKNRVAVIEILIWKRKAWETHYRKCSRAIFTLLGKSCSICTSSGVNPWLVHLAVSDSALQGELLCPRSLLASGIAFQELFHVPYCPCQLLSECWKIRVLWELLQASQF